MGKYRHKRASRGLLIILCLLFVIGLFWYRQTHHYDSFTYTLNIDDNSSLTSYPTPVPPPTTTTYKTTPKTTIPNTITIKVPFTITVPTAIPPTTIHITTITPITPLKTKDSNRVWLDENTYVGGGDGNPIILINNPNAISPTYQQLLSFLINDNTDTITYDSNNFVCADFAERLHNNAEQAGLKCAYVSISLNGYWYGTGISGYTSNGLPINSHALNAFQTTDKGMIYIDDTGLSSLKHPNNMDKIVNLVIGLDYTPKALFPEEGWNDNYETSGEITAIDNIQW